MKTFLLSLLVCLVALPASAQPKKDAAPARFRAGAATSNITPPLGLEIIGGFVPFPSKNVHDELHARAMVLDDGHTRLAIVVCDLLGISSAVSNEARRLIQKNVAIPPQNVLISGTHTHSAASALGSDRFGLDDSVDDYQAFVARRVADAVACAVNNLRPAQFAFGTAQAPEHLFNRRWYLKEGTMPPNPFGGIDKVKMNPAAGSPSLLEPAGPTDPTISILALREPDGRPIAVYSAYSLHYVGGVSGADISADYYGVYCGELLRLLGAERQDPPFVAMMANGTSGDINNINFRHPRPAQKPYAQMRAVAADVAAKVHAALGKLQYRDQVTLDARYREPMLQWRQLTPQELDWAKKTVAAKEKTADPGDLSLIYARRALRLAQYPKASPIPLQVLRIGDVAIGTMPCEVLCEIGLEFKKRCPQQPAFLVSLAHGYLGYLPPPRQHDLGGYETWLGTNRLDRHASERMLDALVEMAAEMKP